MAELSSSDVKTHASWRRRIAGAALIALGVAGVGAAGAMYYDAWATREAWNASPEAATLARQLAEPTPIWLPPATPQPARVAIEPLPKPGRISAPSLSVPLAAPAQPVVLADPSDLSLDSTDFLFLDPPEPGAHARVAITLTNHGRAISSRILLGIPAKWFEDYKVIGTGPAVLEDRIDETGLRTFNFPQIIGGATVTFELHVTALDEGPLAPTIKVLSAEGDSLADAEKPQTFAPTPRPGPVMALDIPRLKLKSSVVQTVWEPPPFTVGQIKGSANITQGNTVLIGHLKGAAGNVFAHLDELKAGDEITATSRGLTYSFVVSRTFEGPNNDSAPMQPGDDARLTLMTCAGLWNPLTHDYPDRLWVIAEPPEQAAVTIAEVSATATAEATAGVAATATALALEPTATPTPVPAPYAGEPSNQGGIGNTRANIEKEFGRSTGETWGRLVVFRPAGREVHVLFTSDPARAALVSIVPKAPMTFDAAVRESRKLFPTDTRPRAAAPEGNPSFVVERFSSPLLSEALGSSDFSVVYTRDAKGSITSIIFGLGEDFEALIAQSRR